MPMTGGQSQRRIKGRSRGIAMPEMDIGAAELTVLLGCESDRLSRLCGRALRELCHSSSSAGLTFRAIQMLTREAAFGADQYEAQHPMRYEEALRD